MGSYFVGVDIGTQGVRTALLDEKGNVVCGQEEMFLLNEHAREEQSPAMWWDICVRLLKELLAASGRQIEIERIAAIAVTSTSGTVIPLNRNNEPLHDALMYSDKRSEEVAAECKAAAEKYFANEQAYTGFNASSGLCKMVWYVKKYADKVPQIAHWVHAADFITGKLCGKYNISDRTNTLKSGYDIFSDSWPDYLYKKLPLEKEWLPEIVSSGEPIGTLTDSLTKELGLKHKVTVVAGMTDGCASQIASGAVKPGDWNTTIGTTMVIKGVTANPVLDKEGRLYNHRHPDRVRSKDGTSPEGYFMPGGAGNTGADWVTLDFKDDLNRLTLEAENHIPSGQIAWPLRTRGERFPFIAPQATGFMPAGLSREQQFVANMEGVAYLEKLAYDMIEGLSGEKVQAIYTAGGGSRSDVWLKIRSNVLNLPIYKMKHISGAVGAAILAASKTRFQSLQEATAALTQVEKVVKPESELMKQYRELYNKFVNELRKRAYI